MISIQSLISSTLRIDESQVDDTLQMKTTPQWDSLKHMELIVAIENTYSIELTGDEIAEMISYPAIKTIIQKHGVTI